MKKFQKKKKGYAITFEVIMTLMMLSLFMNATIYALNGFNIQRHMNTIATSTLIQAAKWGGNDSNAYRATGATKSIQQTAQEELNEKCALFNPTITVSPKIVDSSNKEITVELEWTYPGFIFPEHNFFGGWRARGEYTMESVMAPGKLLGGS